MSLHSNINKLLLVTAATVTAELSEVRSIAKKMSLGVMNAKAISHRAGEIARGFKPIADFIDEMAREVMSLVTSITAEASRMSRLAVDRNIIVSILGQYDAVLDGAAEARYVSSVNKPVRRIRDKVREDHDAYLDSSEALLKLLDEIRDRLKGSQAISAMSRSEASSAGDFSRDLQVVADNLEDSVDRIKSCVAGSKVKLIEVVELLRKEGV